MGFEDGIGKYRSIVKKNLKYDGWQKKECTFVVVLALILGGERYDDE